MLTYGYTVHDGEDPYVFISLQASSPGTFIVDVIPALQYLPRWFPGTRKYWQAMETWDNEMRQMMDEPYDFTRKQIVSEMYFRF